MVTSLPRSPNASWGAAGRLLLGIALLWVACWLSLGLFYGQPTILLHPLKAPDYLKITYLLILYTGLLTLLSWRWHKEPPLIHWGSPLTTLPYLVLGLAFLTLQRLLLGAAWHPQFPTNSAWFSAFLLAFPIAMVEETVFRGYLYGSLRHDLSVTKSALLVSLLFALVHLFRPGSVSFKIAYGVGLTLAALVLTLLAEYMGLWSAIGMHSAWIIGATLDPPANTAPSLWSGLQGEMSAGICSWLLLWLLAMLILNLKNHT